MTLQQWIDYIQQFHSADIDMGLERQQRVAQRLNLSMSVPVITVAGTNGKGSTCKILQSICLEHGLKPCVYMSPHIHRINERVVLGDTLASDAQLIEAFERINQARQQGAVIPLTFFEFTTLAALLIFQQTEDAGVCILEVGLGGRLDATNIIDADIAVVTSIGLDHQEYLGNTRSAIGLEKVGIARANRPLVMGDVDCPKTVQEFLAEQDVISFYQGEDFAYVQNEPSQMSVTISIPKRESSSMPDAWEGDNKQNQLTLSLNEARLPWLNVASAIQALYLWRTDWREALIRDAVANAELPGRCQRTQYQDNSIVLDIGHNAAAIDMLVEQARFEKRSLSVVFAMLSDKDVDEVVGILKPYVKCWFVCDVDTPRNMGKERIVEVLEAHDVYAIELAANPDEAFSMALQYDETVLVTGSFYTVADILKRLDK